MRERTACTMHCNLRQCFEVPAVIAKHVVTGSLLSATFRAQRGAEEIAHDAGNASRCAV